MACGSSGCACGASSSGTKTDKVGGCNSNGCSSGGCNRRNSYDWISAAGISDPTPFEIIEVSFKNGSHKEFFKNPPFTKTVTGDYVLVEAVSGGYDIGKVSLSGELVRLQMKKRRVKDDAKLLAVVRKAHERDLERLVELRNKEREVMVQARAIVRTLNIDMKVGDVEFQGDGKKATFYYTADGRVDFRELIRHFAKDFKVKIEMRQIGARQESARIGGLGNCGRELCCSTWLSDFKSVNTAAARYQNLAINQIKLTGMCGRLKCCLNYELDAYIDVLEEFPERADRFRTQEGNAILVKTDVFKRLMFYTYESNRGKFYPLHVDQVWEVLDMIKAGRLPNSLAEIEAMRPVDEDAPEEAEAFDYENVHNVIQLPAEKRNKKKSKKRKKNNQKDAEGNNSVAPQPNNQQKPPQQKPPQNTPKTNNGGRQENKSDLKTDIRSRMDKPAPQEQRQNPPKPNNPQNQGTQQPRPKPQNPQAPPQQPNNQQPKPQNPQAPPQQPNNQQPKPQNPPAPPQQPKQPNNPNAPGEPKVNSSRNKNRSKNRNRPNQTTDNKDKE